MQETLSIKKMRLAIAAAAMAVIVAFSMGVGAQVAQAEDAVPYGKTASVMKSGWKYTFTNKSDTKGMTLTSVKKVSKKAATNLKVPATYTVKKNGQSYTYKIGTIDSNAFSKASKGAKTITISKNVKKIKKNAFKGCSATKIVYKGKLTKTIAKKNWLKGSKVKTVQAKNNATKVVAKAYSGKARVKAIK